MKLLANPAFIQTLNDSMVGISHEDVTFTFVKRVEGSVIEYSQLFDVYDTIMRCFEWIKFVQVRVPHLDSMVQSDLYVYSSKLNLTFDSWITKVRVLLVNTVSNVDMTEILGFNIDNDESGFEFNYEVFTTDGSLLLFKNWWSYGNVYMEWSKDQNASWFSINFGMRKELFITRAWRHKPTFSLSEGEVNKNVNVLKDSINKMKNEGYWLKYPLESELKELGIDLS